MTSLSKNGPELWDALLSAITAASGDGGLSPVVAGGAVRDYALGVAAKDIDVFVYLHSTDALSDLADKMNATGLFNVSLIDVEGGEGTREQYAQWNEGELIGVLEGEGLGWELNVVVRRPHEDGHASLIRSFDFGIVQAYYTLDVPGEVIGTPAYHKDLAAKTATWLGNNEALSRKRFDRFNARNPGLLTPVGFCQMDMEFDAALN